MTNKYCKSIRDLILSIEQHDEPNVFEILKSDIDVNTTDSEENTPLHYASANGLSDIVSALLEIGAHIDCTNNLKWTPLMQAARHGHVETISILIKSGADLNKINSYGLTALSLASTNGNINVVQQLIDAKSKYDISNTPSEHLDPLMVSAFYGNNSVVNFLLDKGISINRIMGKTLLSPLMFGVAGGEKSTVKLLLDRGADPNKQNASHLMAAEMAYVMNRPDIIGLFGPETTEIRGFIMTNDIMVAIRRGDIQLVHHILVKDPSKCNILTPDGATPLILASIIGEIRIVQLLLEHGANPNIYDQRNGCTALMHAVYLRHSKVAQLLIDKGADINLVSHRGYSVEDFANEKLNMDVLKYHIKSQLKEVYQTEDVPKNRSETPRIKQFINKIQSRWKKPRRLTSTGSDLDIPVSVPYIESIHYAPLFETNVSKSFSKDISDAITRTSINSLNKIIRDFSTSTHNATCCNFLKGLWQIEKSQYNKQHKLFRPANLLKKGISWRPNIQSLLQKNHTRLKEAWITETNLSIEDAKDSSQKNALDISSRSKCSTKSTDSSTLLGSHGASKYSSSLTKLTISLGDKKLETILKKLSQTNYIEIFQHQEIDLESFVELNEDDLLDIGINSAQDRNKILAAIASLKRKLYG